ncbi:MAG: FG-GAP-like repeat-containing protein [Myxococcota bacterium]
MRSAAAVLVLCGCFESYEAHDAPFDSGRDAAVRTDASRALPPRVVGPADSGIDTGATLRWDASAPREDPPPCVLDEGRRVGRLQVEARWGRPHADVVMSPLVIPIAGRPQILVNLGALWTINPRTGDANAFGRTVSPAELEWATHLAAADLDGDERPDIVGIRAGGGLVATGNDGLELWRTRWPTSAMIAPGESGAPTLADLNRDGSPEVVLGHSVLNGTNGEVLWQGPAHSGRGINGVAGPISCVANLHGNADLEVVAGRSAFDARGRVLWHAETPDGLCAVGNVFDGNADLEVALVAEGRLYVLDGASGAVLWDRDLVGRAGHALGGAPALTDADGDGEHEVVVAYGAKLALYEPNCDEHCEEEGIRWSFPIRDESSSTSTVTIFDFESDGSFEVVHNDHYMLRILAARDGTMLAAARNHSRTRTEAPTIADVDGDEQAEIVAPSSSLEGVVATHQPGVAIIGDAHGSWAGTFAHFTQHASAGAHTTTGGTFETVDTAVGFRHNVDPSFDPRLAPNLWIHSVNLRCRRRGRAIARIRIRNSGDRPSPAGVPLTVQATDAPPIQRGRIPETIAPGGTLEVEIPLEADGRHWTIRVDDDPLMSPRSTVLECNEDDNEFDLGAPRCE